MSGPASPQQSPAPSADGPAPGRLRMVVTELSRAWGVATVRRGFAGTLLLALGSLTPAYLPLNSPLWGPLQRAHLTGTVPRVFGTLLCLAGIGLLVDAWFRLRPVAGSVEATLAYEHLRHWAVLAVWSAPLLLAPPIFSQDAYSYAAQGWLVHNHVNPYFAGPGVLPGAFADQVAWVWRYTPAPYGPLQLQIGHLLDWVVGFRPYLAACANRVPALLGVACIGLLLPRIAVGMRLNPAPVAWFAVLNPILVIDFVGGCHNDSLMVGLVVLALWLAARGRRTGRQVGTPGSGDAPPPGGTAPGGRAAHPQTDMGGRGPGGGWSATGWWVLAAMVVGVAASIKQPALLAAWAVPLVARPWRGWRWREVATVGVRQLVGLAVAIGTFALVSVATGLDFGWYNAVNVPGSVVTASPTTTIGYVLQWLADLTGLDPTHHALMRWTHTAGYLVAAALILVMAVTTARRRPVSFLSLGFLALAFGLPALHTWYVLWGGVLFPLVRPGYRALKVAVYTTVGLLSYGAVNLAFRNGAIALGIAGLTAYATSTWLHHRGNERRVQQGVGAAGFDDAPGAG